MKDPTLEVALKYTREGHPSIEELAAAQGITGPVDIEELRRAYYSPEDESIEDFLRFLDESRGHKRATPAA